MSLVEVIAAIYGDCCGAAREGVGKWRANVRFRPIADISKPDHRPSVIAQQSSESAHWRIAVWGTAALILLLPLVAMQFTEEVAWDLADFAVFGAMLVGACGTYELAARMTGNNAYRAAVGVALVAAFILVWLNLAVGIIGTEHNPANLMFGGVLAVGIIGAVIAGFQPHGMARASVATALAQALVGVIALIAGSVEAVILTGFFVALWLTSARLFRKAAREQVPAGAAP